MVLFCNLKLAEVIDGHKSHWITPSFHYHPKREKKDERQTLKHMRLRHLGGSFRKLIRESTTRTCSGNVLFGG